MPSFASSLLLLAGTAAATGVGAVVRWRWPRARLGVLEGFWPRLASAFWGWRGALALGACAATAGLVASGLDRSLQDFFQTHELVPRGPARIALVVGQYWTLAMSGALLAAGALRRHARTLAAGTVALQAVLATFLVTSTLKALTGRRGPLALAATAATSHKTRDATDFAFDVWNRAAGDGRFFWPSGHTATIATFVAALACYAPDVRAVRWVGIPATLLMGLAMIEGDFHWVSDVLAGGTLGAVIGSALGAAARAAERREGATTPP